jgi:hypothetical protein
MSLSRIINTPKRKLRALKRELDVYRPGMFSESQLTELKNLPNKEYKKKLLIYLNAQYFKPNEIKELTEKMFPWWEPLQNAAKLFIIIIILYLGYKLTTFYYLADRVYPKVFENTASFSDGTVIRGGLFENVSMIREHTDSGDVLLEDKILDWLIMRSKKTSFDSSIWTSDETLYRELKMFYRDFEGNILLQEFKKVPFSIESIYMSALRVAGIKNIKIDLSLPKNLTNKYAPFLLFIDIKNPPLLFFSVTDGQNYWNIKNYLAISGALKGEQITFSPNNMPDNNSKAIWNKNGHITKPTSVKLSKNESLPSKDSFIIKNLNTAFAE